jgi:hypothetical protein
MPPHTEETPMAERKDKQKVIGEPMTDEQIAVFLDFRDLDARDPQGRTLLDLIAQHPKGKDYAQALRDAGANA